MSQEPQPQPNAQQQPHVEQHERKIEPSQPKIENDEKNQQAEAYHEFDNIMQEKIQFDENEVYVNQQQNQASILQKRTQQLQEKEQILKYSVAEHQQGVKQLFMNLHNKKKKLLELITKQYNSKEMIVDIGLYEQFNELKKKIQNQQNKIIKLKNDLEYQRIDSVSNQKQLISFRQKVDKMQSEIQFGRRFAATQHVRDYLERNYVHKVSYEDVKYEFQMKTKLKEYLKSEKQAYDKKKQELKKAIEKEGITKKELEEQKSKLQQIVAAKQIYTDK